MSDIKVKAEELEDFASQIGKAERECDDALDAINWHFSSLLANFPGVVPGSIHNLEADLKYSIKKYKSKLDDAQQLIKLTAANMKNDEQKMSGKVGEFLLELVGWYDIQRVFSEYDPITGEKLSAGDRVLAVGFLALTFVPPAKAAGVGGKAAVKGVKAGLPSLAKSPEAFMKIRNVLDPKRVQQAFRSVYNEVVKGPIAATKVWFDKVKKGIGDIPIPQIRQEAFAGVGVVNKTVKDAFGEAKDYIQRIKSSQVDEVDDKGVTKDTGKEYENYKAVDYTGTTKVNGEARDISRRVFQRIDIDYKRIDPDSGLTNYQLMKKGRAPIWKDGTVIELHHLIQREPGSMVEIPASLHDEYNKILHGLVENGGSFRNDPVLKKQYDNFRGKYWRWRAKQIDESEW
ncbi:HNH/ENDO VII family nuclease [Fredinandcohnia onubensis]|uniref:HNH/ENDO VII family nuclease n=1 Tax=Fredinandcohnia onubensis TaxID=1571209 RepID=UPI000C0BEE52|nr:HNH/ENDO VII family nuclease [Fredinandcohnia onubensis]